LDAETGERRDARINGWVLGPDEVNIMGSLLLGLVECVAVLASALGIASGPWNVPQPRRATLVLVADERALQRLVLLRQTEDSEGQPVRMNVTPGKQPSERVLAFDCLPGEYIVRSDHLISAPVAIDGQTCDGHVAALFAAGAIRGRVAAQGTLPRPDVVAVSVSPCRPAKGQQILGTYRVRAAADGSFEAAVPADCLDLTIGARGMAASPVPRLSVTLGEVRQIGSYTLAPGAVLRVSAQSPAGDPLPGASVTLLGADEYDTYLRGLLQNESPQSGEQRRADEKGRAAFRLPPRALTYVVVRSGDLMGFGGPAEAAPGATTAMSVKVVPRAKVTLIAAGDRSWIGGQAQLVALATPQISGRWFPAAYRFVAWGDSDVVSETLPLAGTWRFEMCLQQRGGLRRLEQQTIEITGGIDNTVQFWISRSRFEGRVLVGDAARSGTVVLTQRDSSDQVAASVDEKGHFTVHLAGAGRYAALFTSDDGVVRRAKGIAEFIAPDTITTVRFASTNVSGVVVLPDGSAAAGATVTAKPAQLDDPAAVQEPGFGVAADGRGAFTFQSLGNGDWEIGALLQGRAARPEIVNLAEGASAPALRLVLEHDRTVSGRIVDSTLQPLAFANGWASAEPMGPGEIPGVVPFQTDKQGYFHVTLDRPARGMVQIEVASPGHPAAAFRVTLADSAAVTLTVPRSSAELRLVLPRAEDTASGLPRDLNLYMLVNDEGALLPMGFLLGLHAAIAVPMQSSTTILIPALAPGTWRLVKFPDLRSSLLYLAGVGSLPELKRIVLAPQKAMSVDLRK
jgi:hypothetical protein